MYVTPYLNFDGSCAEAFRFYGELFGGTPEIMTNGESPMAAEVPAELHDRVMHAYLRAGDLVLMASDSLAGRHERPQGIYVSLHVADAAEGARIFGRLAEGGTVTMPFEKTFWTEGFGMLVDRFGTPWMVNVEAGEPG